MKELLTTDDSLPPAPTPPFSPTPLLEEMDLIDQVDLEEFSEQTSTLKPKIDNVKIKSKVFPPSSINKNAHLFLKMVTEDLKTTNTGN